MTCVTLRVWLYVLTSLMDLSSLEIILRTFDSFVLDVSASCCFSVASCWKLLTNRR